MPVLEDPSPPHDEVELPTKENPLEQLNVQVLPLLLPFVQETDSLLVGNAKDSHVMAGCKGNQCKLIKYRKIKGNYKFQLKVQHHLNTRLSGGK